jgi:hypothetical protein
MTVKNPKIISIDDDKEAKLRINRDASLEIFDHLKKINEFLPGTKDSLLGLVYKSGDRVTKPRSYADYLAVRELLDAGITVYSTAKRLKIPYSTCHVYSKMTDDEVKKLKKMDKARHN